MNLREYLISAILVLALLVGGYHYLGSLLIGKVEETVARVRWDY